MSEMEIRHLFRVSLRTSLVILTGLCIFLAVKAKQIRDQKQAVDAIVAAGGRVSYDDVINPETLQRVEASRTRRWLSKHIGADYVANVSLVTLYPTQEASADEQVKMLAGIPYLRNVAIWPGSRRKHTIDSSAPGGLTDEGLRYIADHLPQLRHLSITGSTVTAQGLECLERLDRLESLQVGGFQDVPVAELDAFLQRNPQLNTR